MLEQKCNFWEQYEKNILPKLKEIDVLLKTVEDGISLEEASQALSISEDEILNILQSKHHTIDKALFLKLMSSADSYICRLYQREVACGSPYIYSRYDISYIYNIPIEKIDHACNVLGIEAITTGTLPLIFQHIYM